MAGAAAAASGIKLDKLADNLSASIGDGFLGKSDKSSSSLYTGDWGNHETNINFGGASLDLKKVLLWGGVALAGWFLWKKIKGKGVKK